MRVIINITSENMCRDEMRNWRYHGKNSWRTEGGKIVSGQNNETQNIISVASESRVYESIRAALIDARTRVLIQSIPRW